MAGGLIAALAMTLVATADGAPPQGAASRDPVAAMARAAADLKRCESAPDNMNTMAQGGCYGDAIDAADKILAAAMKSISARLAAEGARNPDIAKDNEEIARRLEAAQRAWVGYRAAECSFAAIEMLGGTGEGLSDAACQFQESRARVERLADWLKANPARP